MTTEQVKLEVGQKVKIRKGLVSGNDYGEIYFNETMSNLIGREFTVKSIVEREKYTGYRLEGQAWLFSKEMFEEAKVNEPTLPIKTLELGQIGKLEIYVEKVIVSDPAIIMFYKTAQYNGVTGVFEQWSDVKKVVAKCNKDIGDKFDVGKGLDIAMLKAFRKEIDKQLRKF
ncbi:hypothetical protein BSK59_15845 [Paenibacillus odorifer]|uniref:hypothetical protein n=1 Tax=Paenibacillus odorifer TaxID=189426 RepID=UPI00096F04F8|nr:hypothetical protein [Paenibacillus odorifer]OME54053.1 hypothetical protein BSK59_15845 [Paenibacillus odorifer]